MVFHCFVIVVVIVVLQAETGADGRGERIERLRVLDFL
jgi:hypothetical protein